MKSLKLLLSLLVAGAVLAACALIPPIAVGNDALGYSSQEFTVGAAPAAAGFSLQATFSDSEIIPFDDIEQPNMPIAPSSFQSVQGFTATVTVSGADLPETIIITSGTLQLNVSDDSGSPEPVEAEATFGPLTLERPAECAGTSCDYTFADAAAAAETLTLTIAGSDLTRLLQIITEGSGNTLTLTLEVETEEAVSTMTFTVEVDENYIRF
ncbi:MAG: hypothetical protein WD273_03440 [Trueperaceae bacterium]